eukprot:g9212.t1
MNELADEVGPTTNAADQEKAAALKESGVELPTETVDAKVLELFPACTVNSGVFKYVQVHAIAPDGTHKVLVRSAPGSFHADVAEPLCEALREKGLRFQIPGGGRIRRDDEKKEIEIYGHSKHSHKQRMKTIALLLCIALAQSEQYGRDALQDEIHHLPGAPPVPPGQNSLGFRHFAGYIDVSPDGEPKGSRQLFYWFVEAQKNHSTAPLFLWTNGGPGCSGLAGFMTENGPFRPGFNGTSLVWNTYSWNKIVNMIFIEQPVGVGFSKGNLDYYGDAQAADDNYKFLQGFFERYPHLTEHDFYLSSESYGGHYLPTLASLLVKRGGVRKFKGVFLGNPLTYMPYRDYGFYGTLWGHQLIPKYSWDDYVSHDCQHVNSPICGTILQKMYTIVSGLDPYALDFPTCSGSQATGQHERLAILNMIARFTPTDRNWESWKVDGQIAGFWTDFNVPSKGSFSFVTVHNAGHMVPSTQPKRRVFQL